MMPEEGIFPFSLSLYGALFERKPDVRPLHSFPAFYGTQRFSTEFRRYLHLFLS
jgi:hypothetical protein